MMVVYGVRWKNENERMKCRKNQRDLKEKCFPGNTRSFRFLGRREEGSVVSRDEETKLRLLGVLPKGLARQLKGMKPESKAGSHVSSGP